MIDNIFWIWKMSNGIVHYKERLHMGTRKSSISPKDRAEIIKKGRQLIRFIDNHKPLEVHALSSDHEHLVDALVDSFSRSLTRGHKPEVVTIETHDCAKQREFRLEPVCIFRIENPNASHALEFLAKDARHGNTWVYGRYNYDEHPPATMGNVTESVGFLITEKDLPRIKHLLTGKKKGVLSLAMLTMLK